MKNKILDVKKIRFKIKLNTSNSYLVSYPYFIEYFKSKNELTQDNLICGAFMIYGWMPTTLKNIIYTNETIELFNTAKHSHLLDENELKNLKLFTNNSLVGLSKLLHFINPEVYPIWDSKICKYLCSSNHNYQVQDVSNYLKYVNVIHETIKLGLQNELDIVKAQLNYNISDVRLIEMSIFHLIDLDKFVTLHN